MNKWSRLLFQPSLPLDGDKRVTGSSEHIALSRKVAEEGMVLLKNDGILPLSKEKNLAVFGKAAVDYVKGGGGSGDVYCKYVHSLVDGLTARGALLYKPLIRFYEDELKVQYENGRCPGMTAEPALTKELIDGAAAFADTALIVINRFSGEGWDRSSIECNNEFNPWETETSMPKIAGQIFPDGDFYLTKEEITMIECVKERFGRVVAVLNIGGVIDLRWLNDDGINAALYMGQGGMEGGDAAAEILLGMINPSGRLVDTYAGSHEDYPSTAGFHESFDYVNYTEDIYVGYRYFMTVPGAKDKVIYPFGYGLSYTSFETSLLSASDADGSFIFNVKVTNTGDRAGKEVVQLYYSAPAGVLGKPVAELGDFAKTRELQPGESQMLTLSVSRYLMSSYDDLGKIADASYVLEKGRYDFYLAKDSLRLGDSVYSFENSEDNITSKLSHQLAPVELKERMLADGSYEALPLGEHRDINESVIKKMEPGTEEALTPVVKMRDRFCLTTPFKKGAHILSEVAEGKISLDEFVDQLTLEEMIHLSGGQPNTGVANTFGFGNLPEYGVPSAMTADGPAGVRIAPETGILTTAFPCATLMASSWNTEILHAVGKAGGEELKENNLAVWLTPAINIHRSPLCGRNFEYYSEDPIVAGKMGAALVNGIQENHVGASVKHFCCNNKETNRKHSDSRVSERALREIYLKAFEIVVKESDPYTIMSAYNAVNGQRASESRDLLTGILRGEWGYKGMVTTDWWTRGEHYKEVNAGNDLKMGNGFDERLLEADKLGALDHDQLKANVKRILATILKFD
ncbi:MAG: glycoside hydrolase family 3 C-terminal domain-containing protein [Agathobacter sp.]|uniref:glycoside hydrolase family 3 protein n=1 Tax=Agathobacter sp. TaxID=2021311 RepID=UPI002584EC59|nr:glycoside hydrolase family 3 protein [Agathobacter sp.]MCR5678119.1 glycoside hydrolase family 3 C-terminal domain-containing protein [Agathobacter sp.]